MATVAAITELETELSQARDAAQAWLGQCAEMINAKDFRIYDEPPPHLLARAGEASAKFYVPLVRVLSLVQQSQMLGTTDADAIRLAVRRIDAALRLRRYDEWEPEILNNEDIVLGVRPAGSSEDLRCQPNDALTVIDDALDQVLRRVGVLRAEVDALSDASPAGNVPASSPPGTTRHKVFIGHGRSQVWREFKDFVTGRVGLPYDEFNSVPIAGITNIARLTEMMETAAIAFIIFTGEDEQADGTMRPRMNAVHEAGLFQGHLGFSKTIVLLEEGCEHFSNNAGLGHISFPKGKIAAAFEEVRRVLEREGLVPKGTGRTG